MLSLLITTSLPPLLVSCPSLRPQGPARLFLGTIAAGLVFCLGLSFLFLSLDGGSRCLCSLCWIFLLSHCSQRSFCSGLVSALHAPLVF